MNPMLPTRIIWTKLIIVKILMMMMITPNSRAIKGGKERGEVKGSMEEFDGRRRGMLTTGEWCNPVSSLLHHV